MFGKFFITDWRQGISNGQLYICILIYLLVMYVFIQRDFAHHLWYSVLEAFGRRLTEGNDYNRYSLGLTL